MYRVAYDNGRETENYFFRKKKNAKKKMEEICESLCISPIRLNQHLELTEWFIRYEKIVANDEVENWNFFTR